MKGIVQEHFDFIIKMMKIFLIVNFSNISFSDVA